MTPQEIKSIMRDLLRRNMESDDLPICAFSLRNGQIYTGHWQPLGSACNTIVVTLINKDAPPIYISVSSIDAIAVDGVDAS